MSGRRSGRILIVGESNPYGGSPHFALWPAPRGCAGWRLCYLVLGLEQREYLRDFDRANLLVGAKWSAPAARGVAAQFMQSHRKLLLLGRRVAAAFGYDGQPFHLWRPSRHELKIACAMIPHPSGRCRAWNDPDSVPRTRAVVNLLAGLP